MRKRSPVLIKLRGDWVHETNNEDNGRLFDEVWICSKGVSKYFDLRGFKRIRAVVSTVPVPGSILLAPGVREERFPGANNSVHIAKVQNWDCLASIGEGAHVPFAEFLQSMDAPCLWAWIEEA